MKAPLLFLLLALPLVAEDTASPNITAAATKFLAGLDDAHRSKAALPFEGNERENFHYTPHERAGLPFKEMNEAQRAAAMDLLATAMSEKGKLKVTQIMALESLLAEIEKNPTYRDPGKYYVTVFGTPGNSKGWGWRFEGHHLTVNITLAGDSVISVTPSFLGSNPAEVREGKDKGLRVLAAEEDLARALVTSLLAAGKPGVIFNEKSPSEIISAENRTAIALQPVGILAADMTGAQREGLITLISEYTGRYRPNVAASDLEKIKRAGTEKIRFAWAGGTKPGEAYYYRIQGPTFLMEAVNFQNNANHIHASWRDFDNDFGRDALREHLTAEPH